MEAIGKCWRSAMLVGSVGLAIACGDGNETDSTGSGGAAGGGNTSSGGAGTGGASGSGAGGSSGAAGGAGGTSGSTATGGASSGGTSGSAGTGGASSGGSAGSGGAGAGGASGSGGTGTGGTGTGGTGTGGTGGGTSTLDCTLEWESGFENGFPGEWLNYDNGSWSPNGTMPSGRVSAWTIIGPSSGEPVLTGNGTYKGWIVGAASESHRAYPGIHTDIATPLVNTFMVYLDADYAQMSSGEWIHFGTWGNEDGMGNGVWALHTMSVRDSRLEFAHTSPFSGEYIGPTPVPDFPTGRWVRFTVYVHYEGTTGFVQVWQDGVAMLRADVSSLASNPGTRLTRAHWGMYASAETSQGIQYNDDIRIWTLDSPLADLVTEPDCHLAP